MLRGIGFAFEDFNGRGSEYCGYPEYHEYELYFQVEGIEHTKTKTKSPWINTICKRFHRIILNELYWVCFRTKVYRSVEKLQADLDNELREYNEQRTHSGKYCYGKTPIETFMGSILVVQEKMIGYESLSYKHWALRLSVEYCRLLNITIRR